MNEDKKNIIGKAKDELRVLVEELNDLHTCAVAKYKCYECDYKYSGKPGPQPPCPKCGSLYIDWLNYKEFEEVVKCC